MPISLPAIGQTNAENDSSTAVQQWWTGGTSGEKSVSVDSLRTAPSSARYEERDQVSLCMCRCLYAVPVELLDYLLAVCVECVRYGTVTHRPLRCLQQFIAASKLTINTHHVMALAWLLTELLLDPTAISIILTIGQFYTHIFYIFPSLSHSYWCY